MSSLQNNFSLWPWTLALFFLLFFYCNVGGEEGWHKPFILLFQRNMFTTLYVLLKCIVTLLTWERSFHSRLEIGTLEYGEGSLSCQKLLSGKLLTHTTGGSSTSVFGVFSAMALLVQCISVCLVYGLSLQAGPCTISIHSGNVS